MMNDLDLLGNEFYKKASSASLFFQDGYPYLFWHTTNENVLERISDIIFGDNHFLLNELETSSSELIISYIDGCFRVALLHQKGVYTVRNKSLNTCFSELENYVFTKHVNNEREGLKK